MNSPRWTPITHVRVADQWVAVASRKDFVDAALADCAIADRFGRVRTRLVFDANGQGVALGQTDANWRAAFEQADIVHADGQFIVKVSAAKCATAIPERAPTTDMIHDFAAACEATGRTFYLLGATEEANRVCAERLADQYPQLKIVGRRNGYFRGHEDEVLEDIRRAAPDFLWVGLGKPFEQEFCARYGDRLNAVWTITCGGCFNFISGDYRRAPRWMQDAGLEWLFRMATEPRKLAWRYITTNPRALLTAMTRSDKRTVVREYREAETADLKVG